MTAGTLAVKRVNDELTTGNMTSLLEALANSCLDINPELLTSFASPLYWEEMVADRNDSGHDLTIQVIICTFIIPEL